MSEIFKKFLSNLNEFKQKLQKLPTKLLSDTEIDHFYSKKSFKIVALGGVGVGKTSLLERLVGRSLPKGKNCCTREAVTLRLPESSVGQVKAGNESMCIEYIDLPGITSMSRPDQHPDYPLFTQNLLDSFATEADLILLCLPADVDIANSDALRRLKDLEIEEKRIICVLSKVDLLEIPENLNDFLSLTRNFGSLVAVRNAPNLEMNLSISEVNSREVEFFSCLPEFEIKFGISSAKSEIIRLLNDYFIKTRNRITARLLRERSRLQERLKYLSDPNFLTNLLTNYIEFVDAEISGDRIGRLYWKSLPEALESVDLLEGIDREHLRVLIKNSQVATK